MSFVDWMNMSMLVDIAFLVFAVAVCWKLKKLQNNILSNQARSHSNDNKIAIQGDYSQKLAERIDLQSSVMTEMGQNVSLLKKDIEITMRNPAAAKRALKERQ